MKVAASGKRGVFWRNNPRGSQEIRRPGGARVRGDWWIRWFCTLGHKHREKIGPKSVAENECERRRLQARREGFCSRLAVQGRPALFEEVAKQYEEWSKANKRSWKRDREYLGVLMRRFAGKTLVEITPQDVETLKAVLVKDRAVATVNRYLACLKHLYSRAIRDGQVRDNPVKGVRLFRENNARVRWLTPEEESKLLAMVPEPYLSFCRVATYTGLRRGELLGLTWDRVDYRTGILTVDRSKHGEARRVPMSSLVQDALRRVPRTLGEPLVFPGCRNVSHRFPGWVEDAGLKDLRLHDLRHTFASRLAMSGVDILTIKELLGHKTLATTLRYSHLSPGHQRDAVEKLVAVRSDTGNDTSEKPAVAG
jgi:integrase